MLSIEVLIVGDGQKVLPFAVRIQHPENLSRQGPFDPPSGNLLFDFDGVMCYFYVTVKGSGLEY